MVLTKRSAVLRDENGNGGDCQKNLFPAHAPKNVTDPSRLVFTSDGVGVVVGRSETFPFLPFTTPLLMTQ